MHGLENTVMLLTTVMVTLVPQHASKAVGGSNVQPVPHSTVLGPAQLMVGGFVSTIVATSVQIAVFEQQSVAFHVKVTVPLHGTTPLLVTTLISVTRTVPQHASNADGGNACQPFVVPAVLAHWIV